MQRNEEKITKVVAIFPGTGQRGARDHGYVCLDRMLKAMQADDLRIFIYDGCQFYGYTGFLFASGVSEPPKRLLEELKKIEGDIELVVEAQSRGCISAYILCIMINADPNLVGRIKIHLDMRDPVPGNLNIPLSQWFSPLAVCNIRDLSHCTNIVNAHFTIQEYFGDNFTALVGDWLIPTFHANTQFTCEMLHGGHMAQQEAMIMDKASSTPRLITNADKAVFAKYRELNVFQISKEVFDLSLLKSFLFIAKHLNLSAHYLYLGLSNIFNQIIFMKQYFLISSMSEKQIHQLLNTMLLDIYQKMLVLFTAKNSDQIHDAYPFNNGVDMIHFDKENKNIYFVNLKRNHRFGHHDNGSFKVLQDDPQYYNAEHMRLAEEVSAKNRLLLGYAGDNVQIKLAQNFALNIRLKAITTKISEFKNVDAFSKDLLAQNEEKMHKKQKIELGEWMIEMFPNESDKNKSVADIFILICQKGIEENKRAVVSDRMKIRCTAFITYCLGDLADLSLDNTETMIYLLEKCMEAVKQLPSTSITYKTSPLSGLDKSQILLDYIIQDPPKDRVTSPIEEQNPDEMPSSLYNIELPNEADLSVSLLLSSEQSARDLQHLTVDDHDINLEKKEDTSPIIDNLEVSTKDDEDFVFVGGYSKSRFFSEPGASENLLEFVREDHNEEQIINKSKMN